MLAEKEEVKRTEAERKEEGELLLFVYDADCGFRRLSLGTEPLQVSGKGIYRDKHSVGRRSKRV